MWLRSLRYGFCVGLAGALWAGCSTKPDSRAPSQERSAFSRRADRETRSASKLAQAHAHYATAVVLDVDGQTEAALEEFYKAALEDPGDEGLQIEVSERYLEHKQTEKAIELLTRAAALRDASGEVFARLGTLYSQLGRTEEAIAASRTAIQKSPDLLAGYQNLYLIYSQARRQPDALQVLDEAARRPKPDIDFLIRLSEFYANYGLQVPSQKQAANQKALELLERAQALNPAAPMLRLKLADGFNLLGASEKAAGMYLDLLKRFPEAASIRERLHAKLADIYLRGSDHRRAIEQLEAVLRDDPTNAQAAYFLGSLAYDEKRLADAVDYFKRTIVLSPDFEQAYYDLAVAQVGLNRGGDALATLETARGKFPASFVLEFLTGMTLSRQKDYAEAARHFVTAEVIAKATDPKRLNHEFYFQVGVAAERQGDIARAETCFQKALELSPKFVEAMNYLGYMWAEHDMKLEPARDLIQKAVNAEPGNAAYVDSLGWVLFKLKQPERALEQILKAVQLLETPDPTVFDHLGDIYEALGQGAKAAEAWRKSLTLEPNEEVRKKIEAGSRK